MTPLLLCIGLDDAGVSGEAFATNQAFSHAALQNALKQYINHRHLNYC